MPRDGWCVIVIINNLPVQDFLLENRIRIKRNHIQSLNFSDRDKKEYVSLNFNSLCTDCITWQNVDRNLNSNKQHP